MKSTMGSTIATKLLLLLLVLIVEVTSAFSLSMTSKSGGTFQVNNDNDSRRSFFIKTATVTTAATILVIPSVVVLPSTGAAAAAAVPQIYQTPMGGIKYAILKESQSKTIPKKGDIVAIEYTGYLIDGTIFDATHSETKKNALVFELGSNVVIDGINDMVSEMGVGEKVQAIIPPELAFGDKGLCLENGECLIKPKSTLVYDIYLKRSAIPPP